MDEWQEVALDDVATLNGGFAFKSSQYTESGRFVLRTVNITDDFAITKDGATFISERDAADYERFALQEHDTLFVMVAATLGKVGYVRSKDLPALLNQNMWVIRARATKIEPIFLHYAFREISKIPLSWVGGSARSFLRRDDVRTLRFKLPPVPEQQAIASILAALDGKIELNRRMNETLEGMTQAIFRDWFVDFGPVRRAQAGTTDPVAIMGGLTPDPARAAQLAALFPAAFGNDGLPVGWISGPFSKLLTIIGGGTPKTSVDAYWNGNIPWFSVTDTPAGKDLFVFGTEKSITKEGLEQSSARLIPAGTTIISARGTVGNLAIAGQNMTFNQSCYALRSADSDRPFFTFLAAAHLVEGLKGMAHGSVFSTITRQTFDGLNFADAGGAVMDAFDFAVAPLFDRIRASVEENKTLAEARDYLLPRLMSGAVRVAPQAEAA